MTLRMSYESGYRRFGNGCVTGLAAILICTVMPAQAQIDLSITQAQSGFFRAGDDNAPPQAICSDASPQFSNSTTYSGPTTCVSTEIIWVTNQGTVATAGPAGTPVVVTIALQPVTPKNATVIATNGYCAFSGGCGGNAGGSIAAGGWACVVTQGNVSCNRNDALAAGATYSPITIRFTREDYSPGSAYNDVATVAGGTGGPAGLLEVNLGNNVVLGDATNFRQVGGEYVTIHSVPEGLPVMVDGQVVPTPHREFWAYNSPHTIDAAFIGGTPFPGSGPWTTFLGFSTGNITTVSPNPSPTTINVTASGPTTIAGIADGPYGQISARYSK